MSYDFVPFQGNSLYRYYINDFSLLLYTTFIMMNDPYLLEKSQGIAEWRGFKGERNRWKRRVRLLLTLPIIHLKY